MKGHGSHDDLYQETYSQGEQGITVKVKKVLYAPLFLVKKTLKETGAHLFANLFFFVILFVRMFNANLAKRLSN